ncbi:C5a anaphylatoxin chemotactic receptor 1 [Pseudoliparis swirei]|uniref:C5a anaphylatoxin chemotactic receptor 1 n=1 Tax=Pseudoliparis swirei TaxID=2059687 RepID=UPI0024BEDEB8|nr:C5a anaphylatoxin chemotactic receptor 1 [Pseudoliparis swirei]
MAGLADNLLGLRVFIVCVGLVGNVFLVLAIVQTKLNRIKSFELFLLGLAAANLEEILVVIVFDVVVHQSLDAVDDLSCRSLKFLTKFGEVASILFTVLISIYRQRKLADAEKSANRPIYLDGVRSAWAASGVCGLLAALLSLPVFAIVHEGAAVGNATGNATGCPLDFFQCGEHYCPVVNGVYKYAFLLLCNLLPLAVVTATGCLILHVLLGHGAKVTPASGGRKGGGSSLHRSTVAVLAAMGLFQLDWTLYLILELSGIPTNNPLWAEAEFLISFSYTSISPYVYGMGNNLFSLRNLRKK